MEEMKSLSSALPDVVAPTIAPVVESPEVASEAPIPTDVIIKEQGSDSDTIDFAAGTEVKQVQELVRSPSYKPALEADCMSNKNPPPAPLLTEEDESKNIQVTETVTEDTKMSPVVDSDNEQQMPEAVPETEPEPESGCNSKDAPQPNVESTPEGTMPKISLGPPAPAVAEPMGKPEAVNKDDEYLLLLNQYLQCIRNKQAHAGFLEDAVVGPFLSLCLGSDSDKVLIGVLKIINVLLKNRDNFVRLKELLHFTDALLVASRNDKLHGAIRAKASTFYETIVSAKKPLGNNDSNADASIEVGKPVSSTREVHLFINHPLQKNRRVIITRALVKIEGVISVAYNPEQQLCVVRARGIRPENLGTTVANLGLECCLIAKNEKKEIVRIPMKPDSMGAQGNDENKQEPFYFPEEDEEAAPGDNAVVRKGHHENDGSETWWNSAKKLARKSLFW